MSKQPIASHFRAAFWSGDCLKRYRERSPGALSGATGANGTAMQLDYRLDERQADPESTLSPI